MAEARTATLRDVLLVAAAVVMYTTNVFMVAVAVALATARNPLALFFDTQRLVYVQFASLYLVGAVAAR